MYLTHVLSLGVLKIYVLFLYVKHVKTFQKHVDIFPVHDVNEDYTIAVGKHVLGRYRFHY